MSISTCGWGSASIATYGWGIGESVVEITLPFLVAEAEYPQAYTCIIARDYVEIKYRDKDIILLRLKPDSITSRMWGVLLDRAKTEILLRLKPNFVQVNSIGEMKLRDKNEVLLRLKPESITTRIWGELLDRSKIDIDIRDGGWPWISEQC